MIEFVGVSKIYGRDGMALRDIDVFIDRGEFVFLVGPSGAGKSTFTRLIYREETPTRGTVRVGNVNAGRLSRRDLPYFRRKIGIVFQDFRLLPDKTVYENVAFAMIVTGASRRQIRRRVPEVLELVGLPDKLRALPDQLSGGEQQRVALARAVVNGPRILVADEPTGNVDPETAWGIMDLLLEINRQGATVLVATHAVEIVNALSRRVIALRNGRLIRDEVRGAYGDAN